MMDDAQQITVGNIAFRRVAGRGLRIIKAKDVKTPEQCLRDHEIAILRMYGKKYPEIVMEMAAEIAR